MKPWDWSYDRGEPGVNYTWTCWVWEITIEVQDYMKITDYSRGIYRIYHNLIKGNWRMSTCRRLDLQTLGSQLVMPKNLPDHWIDHSCRSLSVKSSLARHVSWPIWKLGVIFGTSSFHLPNLERISGSKIGYAHGICYPKFQIGILVGQVRKSLLNSPTPLFVYGNLSIMKACNGWLCVNSCWVNLKGWD